MTFDTIVQTELSEKERGLLQEDSKRWQRLGSGSHLDDWLAFAPGLSIIRQTAMKIAGVNRPTGKGYAGTFGLLIKHYGLHTMDKTSISALLWLNDDPERMIKLNEIRSAMTEGERARLNSPITARARLEKLKRGLSRAKPAKAKDPLIDRLRKEVAERDQKIALLKKQLAEAQRTQSGHNNRPYVRMSFKTSSMISKALHPEYKPSETERLEAMKLFTAWMDENKPRRD